MATSPLRILSAIHPLHGTSPAPEEVAAQAAQAEAGGVERVLIGYSSVNPDGWIVSSYVLASTTSLGVLLAHRPGVMHPVVAARQAATLHFVSRGRLALNVVTGGSPGDQLREGDTVPHDERYQRSIEYVRLLRQLWTAEEPITHDGRFYQATKALLRLKPSTERPMEIFMGGASSGAVEFGASCADVYMLWGEPLKETAERLGVIRARAAELNRELREFSMSFRVFLGETSEQAWARADATAAKYEDRSGRVRSHSEDVGRNRQLRIARESTMHDSNFWTGIMLATGGLGSTAALVGTEDELIDSLARYRELGISMFLLTGPDGVWSDELAPFVRRLHKELG